MGALMGAEGLAAFADVARLPRQPQKRVDSAAMRLHDSLLLLCLLTACRGADTGPPPRADLGIIDSGNADLGVGTDLGNVDGAIPFDGGALDDGAVLPDAAPTDGGAALPDATISDAGPSDAAIDGGPVSMPCMARGACDPFVIDSCDCQRLKS